MESATPQRETVEQLAEEFVQRYRRGERPSVDEYAARYPEHAAAIRDLFPALVLMEQGAPESEESTPAPVRPSAHPERLGDYRILREVGRGGMGVVYEAEQVSLGRHVALKVLPQAALLDERQRKRFEREAKAAARLHHTNIVPVFGVGEDAGLYYYVMQFIPGLGLDKVLDELRGLPASGTGPAPRGGPLTAITHSLLTGAFQRSVGAATEGHVEAPPPVAPSADTARLSDSSAVLPGQGGARQTTYWQSVAQVGVQVAGALDYAHQQGVLHRDVKPSNLLLDAQGHVWVTDFGLAKSADGEDLTHTGDVVGTLRYMAPEAFDGQTDARSEVYSLGLTLYEMLALRPAFGEKDRNALIRQVMTAEPARLDRINRSVPRDLVTIVHKAIDRDPARRYPTAGALADDLQRFLRDEPIRARRVSAREQLVRWGRHHPGVAALLTVLTVVLLGVAVAASAAAFRFERLAGEKDQARGAAVQARDEAEGARLRAEQSGDEARRRGEAERWERYRSNIAAAAAALQMQNTGTARMALEAAPAEHRNWEWQHLHSQLDGARLVIPVPGGTVRHLRLSPSARQVAVSCWDHNDVYLYDVVTGKPGAVLRGNTAPVCSLEYSPDGKHLATGADDGTVRLWDTATGRELAFVRGEGYPLLSYSPDGSRCVFCEDQGRKSRLWDATFSKEVAVLGERQEGNTKDGAAFSPDGKRVAVASGAYVRLWDAVEGKPLAALGPQESPVFHVLYSPDGKRIASSDSGAPYAIHLWDGGTGKEVAVLRDHKSRDEALVFSPDGSRLLAGDSHPDTTGHLWDATTGRTIAVLTGHKNTIITAAFSPDGRRIVTASQDQTARLWDGMTGRLIAVLPGHTESVAHALFSPDGTRVLTASADTTLRLWEAATGELIAVLRGHGHRILPPPVFTPDGSLVLSGSDDGTVRVWDVRLLERNGILRGHESFIYDVAFSPDGQQVASAAWDGTARLWDATTGRETGRLKHETELITSVAYSRDGRRLVTVERERGVTLWDVAARTAVRSWRAPAGYWEADVRAVLNPAGTLLAMGCREGPVRLWDVADGEEVARLEGHERGSIDAAFSPDGTRLATTGQDGTVRLWDVGTRAPVAVLRGHGGSVSRVSFSPDGRLLASGSTDRSIRLWDVRTGKEVAVIEVGSAVYCVAFSPDGTRLAAGCADNTVRLYDVTSRQQVAELRGHTGYVHAVAWSPDGTRLASASGDTTMRVWDALPPAVRARAPDTYLPPRGYVCYRATGPVMIDGRLDDAAWRAVPWTDDFVDIEGDQRLKPRFRTRAKMLWDDKYFYIGAELHEPHVWGTLTEHDSVIFQDNDFEVFIDPDGDNHDYGELELNALNTTWDLLLKKPYRDGGPALNEWEITGLKTAVHIDGTLNDPRDTDRGWTVEIAVPWEALGKLTTVPAPPTDGDQWRVNFSRVEWRHEVEDGQYRKVPGRREDNWVWSPQGVVDMHRPETWGYVQFSTAAPGRATFRPDPAGPARHLLHRIYYAQRAFHEEHRRYAKTLEELALPHLDGEGLVGAPRLEGDGDHFQAVADVRYPDGRTRRWRIREDSRVWMDERE